MRAVGSLDSRQHCDDWATYHRFIDMNSEASPSKMTPYSNALVSRTCSLYRPISMCDVSGLNKWLLDARASKCYHRAFCIVLRTPGRCEEQARTLISVSQSHICRARQRISTITPLFINLPTSGGSSSLGVRNWLQRT